jgi:hypothetical protein
MLVGTAAHIPLLLTSLRTTVVQKGQVSGFTATIVLATLGHHS